MGKLRAHVCTHVQKSGLLKSTVAIRLITGHMIQQMQIEIAKVISCGLSSGRITRKARAAASLPTIKNSSTKAIGNMIGISCSAARNVMAETPSVFHATLYTIIPYTITAAMMAVKTAS